MRCGHLSRHCPDRTKIGGVENAQWTMTQFAHSDSSVVPKHWLLLDSRSTISSICNPDLLKDIVTIDEPVRVFTNGGSQDYHERDTLKLMDFQAYFNPSSMANILSLSEIADMYRITMDTKASPSITVHISGDNKLAFMKCGSRLYFYDIGTSHDDNKNSSINNKVTNYSFLTTVANNKEFFTRQEIEKADEARVLQALIRWPSTAQFKDIVSRNLLVNCTVTCDDIIRADAIYGPAVSLLKEKMASRRPEHHQAIARVPLPLMIREHHASDTLDIDFFYVNGCAFLYTKTRSFKFKSVQRCYSSGRKEMSRGINKVLDVYKARSITISSICADNEFEKIREDMQPIPLDIGAREEHVPRIERAIRTLKERLRCF